MVAPGPHHGAMTSASAALRVPHRQPLPPRPDLVPASVAARLRDELAARRLLAAVDHLPGLQVLSYDGTWWDGQAHVPCLVVRGGRAGRRMRVIETAGECVIVPFSRRLAAQWLAGRRRPQRVELGVVLALPARADAIVVDAWADVTRCRVGACGALLTVGYDG